MSRVLLDVRDVRKCYGATKALDGVGFQVMEGELFGLLGPNGAGKSTLLSILSCLLAADSGEVLLAGKPLRPDDREVRRLIGIVPQELAVYDELTARENLHFLGELYGIPQSALKRRADEVLAAIGLGDRADTRTNTFSGGMKRRLNLGIALVHSPRLLLLDEPTVGVDPQSRNLIFEEVRRLNAAGVTIVYTSHYMEEVQTLCSRIGIMDCGRLVACDSLPNLLRLREGTIRFRVARPVHGLEHDLAQLAGCKVIEGTGTVYRLSCRDTKRTLLHLGALLQARGVEALDLEADEPNLENIFLHLTGRALRD